MANRGYLKTIEDVERYFYSSLGASMIAKTDAPVLSTTSGVYNAVYGAQVWAQLNQEANAFGALPKTPWLRSGWRVISARSATPPTGGTGEGGSLPETTMPTFGELSAKPKTMVHNFEVSEVQEFLASDSDDDATGDLAFMRNYMGNEHREHINASLLDNVTNIGNVDGTTYYNFESIDRVVSSYAEVTNCGDVDANDSDIYSQNRDAQATWTDAYVDHASDVNRSLTTSLLRTCISNVMTNGGNPTFWMTGYDTLATIQGLFDVQARYDKIGTAQIQPSVNGIVTPIGNQAGMTVATVYNYPILVSKNVVQDSLSRIYLLDTSNPEGFDIPRLSFAVARPTQYFEAGMNVGDPFGINKLGNEGMYRTMGELRCTFFKAQGKIRDLA